MLVFAFYLLKVTICSGILLGYYWLMLRNKVFHQYNRFYLLAVVLLSLATPLVHINIWRHADEPAQHTIKFLQAVSSSNEYLDEIIVTAKQNSFSTEQLLSLLYAITSLIFLAIFVQALMKIYFLFKKHGHSVIDDIYFVHTTASGTPFSFLKYIFWNDQIDPQTGTGNKVFRHELAHVQQKHSYDKLFMNITLIFFWCNPFFWLIRKELNMIHEFVADKIALEDNDTETFAAMILQSAYPQHRFQLVNPFFYSPIKRRLMMLTKNRNTKAGYISRLMVLPLTVLIFAAFTLKSKTFKENIENYSGKKITVVIDAGHGGPDMGATGLQGKIFEKDLTLAITKRINELNTNDKIDIVLTRNTDIYQTPNEKVAFTKAATADLVISIHMGGSPSASFVNSGLKVYVANNTSINTLNSQVLASALINEFKNNYQLPVAQEPQQVASNVKVLQDALCPAILIEAGNISNSKDLSYLNTASVQDIIAAKVLAAVEKYAFAKEEGNIGASKTASAPGQPVVETKKDTVPRISLSNQEKELIIADGKEITYDELKKMKPETIESMNVIKDKEGLAKYGEKGKNGVILITSSKKKEIILNKVEVTIHDDTLKEQRVNLVNAHIVLEDGKMPPDQPLYIIDGKVHNGTIDLKNVSGEDIERINVLKGKNATDKYGEKAINGAVEVFTKNKILLKEVSIKAADTPKVNALNEVVVVGYGNQNTSDLHDDKIFTKTETEPEFPGGSKEWQRYLMQNLKGDMPVVEGWKSGVYKIVVRFIVRKDGSIADIRTDDYAGSKTAEHCIDLIRKGPKWKPAVQNGIMVNCYKKQPITFVVEDKTRL